MELFRWAAVAANALGPCTTAISLTIVAELVGVMPPLSPEQDHGHGDDAAEDGGDAKGVEGDGGPDPGPDAGQQLDVAGPHAADGVGRQEQSQAQGRAEQAPGQALPAEAGRRVDQPLTTSGKVIQFGTLSFQPSITAATTNTRSAAIRASAPSARGRRTCAIRTWGLSVFQLGRSLFFHAATRAVSKVTPERSPGN